MKYLVVGPAEKFANADTDFIARGDGCDEIASLTAKGLRNSQRRWEDHRAGMEDRPVMHVVLLGEV